RLSCACTEVRGHRSQLLATGLPVAPANIGPRSTPNYEALANAATSTLPGGIKVFAGPRDDPFFVDLGSIFDLGGLRPLNPAHVIPLAAANGVDGLAGYNTHSVVIQVPKSMLTTSDPVIGVWSTTYRRHTRVLRGDGAVPMHVGHWTQVSPLGMPLVNEVVVPLGQKDRFNASSPERDAQFGQYVSNPELARLVPVLYPGVSVPPAPRNSDIVP